MDKLKKLYLDFAHFAFTLFSTGLLKRLIVLLFVFSCTWSAAGQVLSEEEGAESSAVILLYHHISDTTPAATRVTPNVFEQHLQYLQSKGFHVIRTQRMLASIDKGEPLPEKSIAIHFDDAYESVYTQAFPLLKALNWPFSIFVAIQAIDDQYQGYMTWEQLAEVADYGAEIGGHSLTHSHLVRSLDDETTAQWLTRVSEEIDRGNQRIEDELDTEVSLFAYPYGEFNEQLTELLGNRGIYGLAQHSGAVGALTNLYAVPRYPIASGYDHMGRFELVANSKPLPVTQVEAGELVRIAKEDAGFLTLRLAEGDYQVQNLACYSSAGATLALEINGPSVRIALPEFRAGRNKVNCTAPSISERGVYYWFSQLWLVKTEDADWWLE